MTVTIRMTEEQRKLADSYAKCKGVSLSEAIKNALFEAIEDEFDVSQAELALDEYEKTGISYTQDEMKKRLGVN